MSNLIGKIDFAAIVDVRFASLNNGTDNIPRTTLDGYGVVSDVCIKRKIRNRLQDIGRDLGIKIFVQSDDRCDDGYDSLSSRAKGCEALKAYKESIDKLKKNDNKIKMDPKEYARIACEEWIDVRAFGQVFAFKKDKKETDDVSVGVRGPVSIQRALSLKPVNIINESITKSVNGEAGKNKKASDTMGTRYYVESGTYIIRGAINVQTAERTGFSQEDAELIKQALITLFENDESSARPAGSMEVKRVYWWQHECKTPSVSSAKIQRSLIPNKDFTDVTWEPIEGCVAPDIIEP